MFNKDTLKNEALRRFTVEVASGQKLFAQNDKGNTLYIIVEGHVRLVHSIMKKERTIAILGPGEIVGEKALCSSVPYRRAFTAIAESDTTVLEFDGNSLKAIASKLPDFSIKMLEVVVQRLDKANELVAILQIPQPADRIVQYLLYLYNYFGKKSATGGEFGFNLEETCTTLNLPENTIQEVMGELVAEKILTPREKGYLLADENALLQHLPALRERTAA